EIGQRQKGRPEVSSFGIRKALFTSTSSRPRSFPTRSKSASTAASSRRSQRTGIGAPAAPASSPAGGAGGAGGALTAAGPRGGGRARAGEVARGSRRGELEGAALPDAAARAGDDRNLPGERARRAHRPPSAATTRAASASQRVPRKKSGLQLV